MLRNLKAKASNFLDTHTLEVLTKSISSSFVKAFGMGLAFIISIYLGRVLGADGLGIINLTFRIVTVLLIFGLLGMTQVIIREVAIATEDGNKEQIGKVLYTAYLFNGGLTLIISIIFIFLSPYLANNIFNEPRLTYPLMIALLAMTPQLFSLVFAATLVGKRKIWQSSVADQCLNVAITATVLFILWVREVNLTIEITAISYGIGRITVAIFMGVYWRKFLFKFEDRKLIFKDLISKSYPVFIASLSLAIITNSGVIVLGIFSTSRDVGLYTVAVRLAEITIFVMQVVNSSVAPKISSLFKQGKINELELMLKRASKILFMLGLIFFIAYIIFGKHILTIWGDEFSEAYWILIILCLGQFINMSTGAAGQLLTMTGNQKKQRTIGIWCVFLLFTTMPILVAIFGPIGAAASTSICIASFNIASLLCAQKITNIKVLSNRNIN